MELGPRQRLALEAICDTFVPRAGDLPSASEMGVPEAIVASMDQNPRADERERFAKLLAAWDTRGVTALGGGGLRRFTELEQAQREEVLLSWADSRLAQRRAAFQALRKAVLLLAYTLPTPDGGPNPRWRLMGYPGRLGSATDDRTRPIQPLTITRDTNLACDVCVIGSGAGGGVAAAVLAEAGLDVVVLEAGGYYDTADFDGDELAAYERLYLEGAAVATTDQSVGLLAGSCLGGGTVVNYTTSFRTPGEVREEWAARGVASFAGGAYTRALDAVCERLDVNTDHNRPSMRDELMRRGLNALGWHVAAMPRNVSGCDEDGVCGYCGFGCALGAKRSTLHTWLRDADASGARICVRTRAVRVHTEGGAVHGVIARTASGHKVQVRCRAAVAACGAIHTPALLRRSGVTNPNVGRHLRLHPATVVWGAFDDEVRPWEGTMQALYSDEHRYLDGGYGVKYETAAVHPGLLVAFAPWRGSQAHAALTAAVGRTSPVGVLLRDHGDGEVRVGPDGEPRVRYGLTDADVDHVRQGVEGAARILEAAGAREIFSSHTSWVAYRPGTGRVESFVRDADAAGWGPGRCTFFSFHIMGSARMGGWRSSSACTPEGETWDVRNLYVCDGSVFPTAPGVNPMVSIEATAHMNATGLADRLT